MPLEVRLTGSGVLAVAMALMLSLTLAAHPAGASQVQDIDALVLQLADQDRKVQIEAGLKLSKSGQSIMPCLIDLYEIGTPRQRRGAILGLSVLPLPTLASDTMLAALADSDDVVRSTAAGCLALFPSELGDAVVARLADGNTMIRDAAALSIMIMGERAVPALTNGLSSSDEFARAMAAWFLGRLGPRASGAIPSLIHALHTPDERSMHIVAEAIDLIGPDPSIAVLHLLEIGLQPGCPATRIGPRAAPTLIRLLNRPGTPTGQLAFRALSMAGPAIRDDLARAVHEGPVGQRTAAALLLVTIDPEAVRELPDDVRRLLAGVRPQPKQ